jgi:hypothetical protein
VRVLIILQILCSRMLKYSIKKTEHCGRCSTESRSQSLRNKTRSDTSEAHFTVCPKYLRDTAEAANRPDGLS